MTTYVEEFYKVARAAGWSEDHALIAARAIAGQYESRELATKADLAIVKSDLSAAIAHVESTLIKWMIGTVLTTAGLILSIAIAFKLL